MSSLHPTRRASGRGISRGAPRCSRERNGYSESPSDTGETADTDDSAPAEDPWAHLPTYACPRPPEGAIVLDTYAYFGLCLAEMRPDRVRGTLLVLGDPQNPAGAVDFDVRFDLQVGDPSDMASFDHGSRFFWSNLGVREDVVWDEAYAE